MKLLRTILQSKLFYLILTLLIVLYVILNALIIKNKSIYKESDQTFYGTIINIKKTTNGYSFLLKNKENIICYSNSLNYQLGDYIKIDGILTKQKNNTVFNNFSYKSYLEHNKIYYTLNVKNITLIKENNNILYLIKNKILKYIDNYKSSNYLKTFLIGDSSYLDDSLYESFQLNGISFLLSIKSIYISFLIYYLLKLFKKNKILDKISNIVIFIIMLLLLIITNYNVVVIRIFIFFILKRINKKLKLRLDNLKLFILTIIITLLINPYYIYHKGFIYSYSISFIIILNQNNLKGNYFLKLIKISFITFIYSIPFNIYFNYSINLLSIIYSIIYIPLFNIVIIPFSLIILLIPIFDNVYFAAVNLIVNSILSLNKFTFGILIFKKMSIIILIIYLIIFTYTICSFFNNKKRNMILIVIILLIHYNINSIIKQDYLVFIDVGQGDSSLFCSNNECILIDTGGLYNKNISKETIIMLKSFGISKIDTIFFSHGDFDHMGDSIYFVNNFKVNKVIFNSNDLNKLELDLIKELNNLNIKYELGYKDFEYHFNNIHIKLLNYNYSNENDSSLIMYIIFNNKKILLMGDASSKVEEKLLNDYNLENIDILKVSHHGSKTSSSNKFINNINPEYSIISVGKNNRYGHPNKEVLDNLSNSTLYRTDIDGSIKFIIKNNKLIIETCSS